MFYHVFYQWLSAYVSWLNVFKYQTFRAMAAFVFSFAFVLIVQPWFIKKLKQFGVKGQPIREVGPKDHETKKGTPTMGGLVIIVAVFVSGLLFCELTNPYVWFALSVMALYAAVGFFDDWAKITRQNSDGLSERQKMGYLVGIAFLSALILFIIGFSTDISVPFLKEYEIPLGWLFIPFVMLVMVGSSNAVNLTDGLDGLAIGPVMTVAATYGVFAYLAGNIKIAEYLQIPHVPGSGELAIILASLLAGGLGFLWYNTFPAQVFMGDTGSLALGGVIGLVAILVKQELVLVIAGGIFVIEAVSVIVQRYYYKLTKKRVFRMAPIHHHFELLGWAEPKIIVRFWIISLVLAVISLSTLKLR